MNICIFGDSITEGQNDNEKGGWVNRLKEARPDDHIFNLGIDGDSTGDVLVRFDKDITGKNPDIIIFAIGVNDSVYIKSQDKNLVEFDKFKENIIKLINKARQFCESIIFVGLVVVDEKLVAPVLWEADLYCFNREIEKYDEAIRNICEEKNLKFIDINSEMKKIDYKKLLDDGLHPNAEGHQWLAEKVAEGLA